MKRVLIVAVSALMAAALNADVTGGTPAFAAAAPAAAQGEKTLEEICREGPRSREVEIQKIEPIKVFDNLYHVGPCYVSVWILTTPDGHIMFDTAQEPFIEHTLANIAKIGINLRDIKYILINHGHLDHAGGAYRFQQMTGARVLAVEADWPMIEAMAGQPGGRDPERKPNQMPRRDVVVRDGHKIDLGDQHLTLYAGPGHTPGVLVATGIVVKDGAARFNAVWGNSGDGGEGLAGAERGLINATNMATIKDVRVIMQTHAWQGANGPPEGGIHERAKRLAGRKAGDPHPYVDPAERWLTNVTQDLAAAQKRLAEERAKAAGAPGAAR